MDSGDRVEGTPMVTERTCSGNGLLTTVTNCSFPTAHDRSTYFHYFTAGGENGWAPSAPTAPVARCKAPLPSISDSIEKIAIFVRAICAGLHLKLESGKGDVKSYTMNLKLSGFIEDIGYS